MIVSLTTWACRDFYYKQNTLSGMYQLQKLHVLESLVYSAALDTLFNSEMMSGELVPWNIKSDNNEVTWRESSGKYLVMVHNAYNNKKNYDNIFLYYFEGTMKICVQTLATYLNKTLNVFSSLNIIFLYYIKLRNDFQKNNQNTICSEGAL